MHNSEIDEDLKQLLIENEYLLSWIPYDEFTNTKEISKGGFTTVYHAEWHDKSQNLHRSVALKLHHNSNNSHEEFINEVSLYLIFLLIMQNINLYYYLY